MRTLWITATVLLAFGIRTANATEPALGGSLQSVGYALENGDTNGDLDRDLSDAIYTLGYLFLGGPEPVPLAYCGGEIPAVENGDVNADGQLNVSDATRLLGWLFSGGPAPAAPCGDGSGGARNRNPRVIPPHANAHGQSYGAWSADWWTWALEAPGTVNPLLDETGEFCATDQSGSVWYLAGRICLSDVEIGEPDPCTNSVTVRNCTVPTGKAIFFPVANSEADNLGVDPPMSEDELREAAAGLFAVVTTLECEVDGVPIAGLEPGLTSSYRVQSPDPFSYDIGEDSLLDFLGLDLEPQTVEGAVADGVFLMLAPLSKGEHVVRFFGDFAEIGFSFEVTYNLTVE